MNTVTLNRNMFLSDTGEYGRIFIFSPLYEFMNITLNRNMFLSDTGECGRKFIFSPFYEYSHLE